MIMLGGDDCLGVERVYDELMDEFFHLLDEQE